jgi:hypothetical protein
MWEEELMSPAEAQNTNVVRIAGFLSDEEVDELLVALSSAQKDEAIGVMERGPDGEPQTDGVWRTSFLHSNGYFRSKLPHFREKFSQAIVDTDSQNWKLLKGRSAAELNFRTVECHEYGAGGRLAREDHFDGGSLITLDVLLTEPGVDFDGGAFVVPETDGSYSRSPALCHRGDALMFVSHKYHNVEEVTR